MAERRKFFSTIWSWLGHVSRAVWLYHLIGPLVVAGLTFFEGLATGFPLALLIPLTVVAAGATVYLVNQVVALFSRFREGYAYGLAYEGPYMAFNPQSDDANLQLGVTIRNVTANPLRYTVDRFDVVVGDRTIVAPVIFSTGGIIPRGCTRTYFYPPFKREQIQQFMVGTVQGSITVEFLYGHPDGPLVRRLTMKLLINLKLNDPVGLRDLILSESDEKA